jgi:acyl-CoA thioester hydrolase
VRVRYGETDQMGVVYHAHYLAYMDEARTALLGELGRGYAELERSGVGLVVRKVEVRYRAPARFGDELVVRVQLTRVGGASLTFDYDILRAGGTRVASGMTELACLDLHDPERRVRMLPDELRGLLAAES